MDEEIRYDAFISYRHCSPDKDIAIKLHKSLEKYRLPGSLARKIGRKKLNRVFRDEAELAISPELSAEIEKALLHSDYLIVICTPRLQQSEWCMKEIETFLKISDRNHILLVLADGEPAESFPEILTYEEITKTDINGNEITIRESREPLAGDCRGKSAMARNKAISNTVLRLCAVMFGVHFDDLKQREKERIKREGALLTAIIFLVVFFIAAQNTYYLKQTSMQNELIQDKLATITANSSAELIEDGRPMDALYVARSVLPSSSREKYNINAYRSLQNALNVYTSPELYSVTKIIPIYPSYLRFNADYSLVMSMDNSYFYHIYNTDTGDEICNFYSDENAVVRFDQNNGVLSYNGESATWMNVYTGEKKTLDIPPVTSADSFFNFHTSNDNSSILLYCTNGIYGISDGEVIFHLSLDDLGLSKSDYYQSNIYFSNDGNHAACYIPYDEDTPFSEYIVINSRTGEIINTIRDDRPFDGCLLSDDGIYIFRSNWYDSDSKSEIYFYEYGSSEYSFEKKFENESFFDMSMENDIIFLSSGSQIIITDKNLNTLGSMGTGLSVYSYFSYEGYPAFFNEKGSLVLWDTDNNIFEEKQILSEKIPYGSYDELFYAGNKVFYRRYGKDYISVYTKNETDCLIKTNDPGDYDYYEADDVLRDFAKTVSVKENINIVETRESSDGKYYALQTLDSRILFYDKNTKECVNKSYLLDGTIQGFIYCSKYDSYLIVFTDYIDHNIAVVNSDFEFTAEIHNVYCHCIDEETGDPILALMGGDSYYRLKLLSYEEAIAKADEKLKDYVPEERTLYKYGLK